MNMTGPVLVTNTNVVSLILYIVPYGMFINLIVYRKLFNIQYSVDIFKYYQNKFEIFFPQYCVYFIQPWPLI